MGMNTVYSFLLRQARETPVACTWKFCLLPWYYRNVPCLICGFSRSRSVFYPWTSLFLLLFTNSPGTGERDGTGIVFQTMLLFSNWLQLFFLQVINHIVSDILFGTKIWAVNKTVYIEHTHRKTKLSPFLLSLVPLSYSPTFSLFLRFCQQCHYKKTYNETLTLAINKIGTLTLKQP